MKSPLLNRRLKLAFLVLALALEAFFWVSYLLMVLIHIPAPFADILWLSGAALGLIFGLLGLADAERRLHTVFSFFALTAGGLQLLIWVLAMLITTM